MSQLSGDPVCRAMVSTYTSPFDDALSCISDVNGRGVRACVCGGGYYVL